MKGNRRYIQGYNAQAVVNEQQIVIAAEISTAAGDFSHLRPMTRAGLSELERAGVGPRKPTVAVADAQYWNEQHMDDVTAEHGIQVLIPPDSGKRQGERPGRTGGRYSFMRRVLASELGKQTVPETTTVNRAGLRPHQTQPTLRPLPPKRQVGCAYRAATNHALTRPSRPSRPTQGPGTPTFCLANPRRRSGTDSLSATATAELKSFGAAVAYRLSPCDSSRSSTSSTGARGTGRRAYVIKSCSTSTLGSWMDLSTGGSAFSAGPLDERDVLLVVQGETEASVRSRFAADPWIENGMVTITAVRPWTIFLEGRL